MRATLFLSLIISSAAISQENLYTCNVQLPDGTDKTYSLSINEEDRQVYLSEGSQQLEINRFSSTQIFASKTVKTARSFEYDNFTFRINRVTGAVEIFYSLARTDEEVESCRSKVQSDHEWRCEYPRVLAEYTEQGFCEATDPEI